MVISLSLLDSIALQDRFLQNMLLRHAKELFPDTSEARQIHLLDELTGKNAHTAVWMPDWVGAQLVN